MPRISPALWAKLSVLFTAFIGAFLAGAQDYALAAHPGLDLKHIALGAIIAGVAAAWHRYQPPPLPKPAGDPGVIAASLLALALLACGGCGLLTPADSPKVVSCLEQYASCVDAYPTGPEHRAEFDACAAKVRAACLPASSTAVASASASAAPPPVPVASAAPAAGAGGGK